MMMRIWMLLVVCCLSGCASVDRNITTQFISADKTSDQHIRLLNTFDARNKAVRVKTHVHIKHQKNVHGFITIIYDEHSHPIVTCEPLHLCVVKFEQGEVINSVDLGDSANWLVSTSIIGTHELSAAQMTIKPKAYDIATDMIVTTNKRIYNIGLKSEKGHNTHLVSFEYPQDANSTSEKIPESTPVVNVDHLNFDYSLSGDATEWKPVRVFDDGDKTFIQFPARAERFDLPVLYVMKQRQLELVNYRYQRPYYVVDSLFREAVLVSGSGRTRKKVSIRHL